MQTNINTLLDPVVNFGKVIVSTIYTDVDTVIVLAPNHGLKLPNPSTDGAFNLIWYNSSLYSSPSDDPNVEIVRCTGKTGDTLTVTRGQEGKSTSAKNSSGDTYKMVLSPTKKTITDIQTEYQSGISTHSALSTGVHGVGTSTVESTTGSQSKVNTHAAVTGTSVHGLGTMSTQTSSAVNITGGTITGITDLAIADGGTGASDAATARTNLGLTDAGSLTTGILPAARIPDTFDALTIRGIGYLKTDINNGLSITDQYFNVLMQFPGVEGPVISNTGILPVVSNAKDLGSASNKWRLVRATTVTQGDIAFEEESCAICKELFKVGDILSLQVVKVGDIDAPTRCVPVHQQHGNEETNSSNMGMKKQIAAIAQDNNLF